MKVGLKNSQSDSLNKIKYKVSIFLWKKKKKKEIILLHYGTLKTFCKANIPLRYESNFNLLSSV